MNDREVLEALYATVENRRDNPKEGSYTCYLLDKGIDKILKKVGEECSETIIAAKNDDNSETVYEIADLIYHLTVMMVKLGIPLDNAYAIGDSANDLPMLEAVPNSIAMGGAERIYPYVSYVTTPIEKDGIANSLKHYGLI